MYRKLIVLLILVSFLSISSFSASADWSDTWNFEYNKEELQVEEPEEPQQEQQIDFKPQADVGDFNYSKQITIDCNYISSSEVLYGFPVYINIINDDNLADNCISDSGYDICFFDSTNNTQFPHEIEKWVDDGTYVNASIWVNVSIVSGSVDTIFYMYYGYDETDQSDHAGVWDGHYLCVYHMNDTTGGLCDSSPNGNHATLETGATPNYRQAGTCGYAIDFDGSSDGFNLPDNLFVGDDQPIGMYALAQSDIACDGVLEHDLICMFGDNNYWMRYHHTRTQVEFKTYDTEYRNLIVKDCNLDTSNYAMYYGTSTGTVKCSYYNGSFVATESYGSNGKEDSPSSIGYYGAGDNAYWDGDIDEVRISDIPRNSSWIGAVWNTSNDSANGSFLTISGPILPEGNTAPVFSNPNPSNESTDNSISTDSWNITIEDPEGNALSWSIEGSADIGINSSADCSNGSYNISIATNNLSYSSTYTIWVNASDGTDETNETFNFQTEDEATFNVYSTLSFGGKAGIESVNGPNVTINGSSEIGTTYATLYGYVEDNRSKDTEVFFQVDTVSDFSSLDINVSNGTIAEGVLFYKNITTFDNGTYYYIRTAGNNVDGFNTSWNYSDLLTKPQPATDISASIIGGGFNISWTHGNGYNVSVLRRKTTGWPQHYNDGDLIYQGTNDFYHDIDVSIGNTYYYRVWEYTNWSVYSQFSDGNSSIERQYQGSTVVFSNPYPENESTNILWNEDSWNITIESPVGATFNWTIQGSIDIGINASNDCENGSYNISIATGNLTNDTTYYVWVNSTQTNTPGDALNWTNETFWFTTYTPTFSAYDTLSFGGKCDVQGTDPDISFPYPGNGTYENDMYPWLNVTVSDPQGTPINVTWLYDIGGGWVEFAYNTTTSGSTVRQRATFFNHTYTKYNWSVHVNDSDMHWTNETYFFYTANYSWGSWSSFWEFTYTTEAPSGLTTSTWNETAINLTWTNPTGAGWDSVVLLRNESGWPTYPTIENNASNIIDNGTNESFNDTGLAEATTYYYTICSWNETNVEYSATNDTEIGYTQGSLEICCPYPVNESTSVARPPTNVSVRVNGTNFDVYLYFNNMTAETNATTLFANWTEQNTDYFSFDLFNWSEPGDEVTDWIWGDVDYIWYANVTDGSTWVNTTYVYTTEGKRWDVDASSIVSATDASKVWNHRSPAVTYNGIYDVDYSTLVTATDASIVWANRDV